MSGKTLSLWLTAGACMSFAAALSLPLFSVEPAAGRWTPVVKLFARDEFGIRSFTLPGGILTIWVGGEWFLAVLLSLVSLVLPVAKLCVLWWEGVSPELLPVGILRFFRAVSHYAMVEVFLISLTVLVIKGMPGGSEISLHSGTYAFTASVLLSLAASQTGTRKPKRLT